MTVKDKSENTNKLEKHYLTSAKKYENRTGKIIFSEKKSQL